LSQEPPPVTDLQFMTNRGMATRFSGSDSSGMQYSENPVGAAAICHIQQVFRRLGFAFPTRRRGQQRPQPQPTLEICAGHILGCPAPGCHESQRSPRPIRPPPPTQLEPTN
jgi:hypothetical protein